MQIKEILNQYGSRLALGLIGFLLLVQLVSLKSWQKPDAIRHDMNSYYSYLPAAFIHHDLSLSFDHESHRDLYSWTTQAAHGRVQRMTMGVALMQTPFFLTADGIARLLGWERNPTSPFYLFWIFLGSVVYLFLGLLLLYQLYTQYFSKWLVLLGLVILAFGTNLYYYSFHEAMMSHVFLFFLYSALLLINHHWHQQPSWGKAILLGLVLGLLVLIRPVHLLALWVPILYQAGSAEKWRLLRKHLAHVGVAALLAFSVFFLQMLYWKSLSGTWFYYSYGDEGFFWGDSKVWEGLVGFRKGWLVYSPLMILSILGIPLLWKKAYRHYLPMIGVLVPIYVYVVFSWWCWWYGGGFGSRPMIDILPILLLPTLAWMEGVMWKKHVGKALLIAVVAMGIWLNLFQTKQYLSTLLHWDGMTRALYQEIFMSKQWPKHYEELVKSPDYEAAKRGERD